MNKQPDATARTKQNLIDAFWELYCEKRIEQITVREITGKAGYNRGTFYEYFTDVYDLLDQIEGSLIPKETELPPIFSAGQELPLGGFMNLYEVNGKYYSVLLGSNGDPAFARKLKASIKPAVVTMLEQAEARSPLETDYLAEFVLSAMIDILSYWFQKQKSLPAERLIALIATVMQHGIAHGPGSAASAS